MTKNAILIRDHHHGIIMGAPGPMTTGGGPGGDGNLGWFQYGMVPINIWYHPSWFQLVQVASVFFSPSKVYRIYKLLKFHEDMKQGFYKHHMVVSWKRGTHKLP